MRILAIDQSLDGAIAIVEVGRVLEVRDIPTVEAIVNNRKRREHAPALAVELIQELANVHAPDLAAIEWLHAISARPKPGETPDKFQRRAAANGKTNFSLGAATYTYLTACAAVELPVVRINPRTWKKTYGLGKDKDASRKVALDLFPGAAHWLKRRKDHDRAEAILIAEHVRRAHSA